MTSLMESSRKYYFCGRNFRDFRIVIVPTVIYIIIANIIMIKCRLIDGLELDSANAIFAFLCIKQYMAIV